MEGSEKRSKRSDEREMDRKRRKGEEVDGGQSVTEDEVEEFFAILRRIQVSMKYFEKNKCDGRKLTDKRWRPRFEPQDFDDKHNGVHVDISNDNGGKKDENAVGDSGLDLNSDPDSLNNSV